MEGEKIAVGGEFDRAKKKIAPTILDDITWESPVMQEEIFGPVVCLIKFKDEAEGLKLANDVEYGLASYIWTNDLGKAHRVARGIEAGMVFITVSYTHLRAHET